jgi:hypothetical protein
LGKPDHYEHLRKYVPYADRANDDYNSNIQIAELNALNATMVVIKWKQMIGFYNKDLYENVNSTYTILMEDCLMLTKKNKPPKKITHLFVTHMPPKGALKDGIVYISLEYKTVLHKCACGCGSEISTPLTPRDWCLSYNG